MKRGEDDAGQSRQSHFWMLNAYILFYGAVGTFVGSLALRAPEPLDRIAIGILIVVGVAVAVRLIGRYTRAEPPWDDD